MKSEIQTMTHEKNNFVMSGDIFDGRYYSFNKRLLSLLGHWPYQSERLRSTKFWLLVFVSCTGLGPQMLALIFTWGKLDAFVACFGPIWTNIGCLIILSNFRYHIHTMRKILDHTRNDWESVTDLAHLKILQERGEKSRLFTIAYSSTVYCGTVSFVITPLVPKLLDVLIPLNHSRPRLEIFPTDYLVDPDTYFWPIFFHLGIGIVIVLSPALAIDGLYASIGQHASGMFEILRYDLDNMLEGDGAICDVILEPKYDTDIFYHHIVACIERHKVLVNYVSAIQSSCEWVLFMVIWMGVLAVSFAGYQLVAKSTPREDMIRMGIYTVAQIYHLYCVTLPGHWISDASSFLADSVYGCKWYMMSLRSRKLIVLFIRASIEPCTITAGKIYVMSVENFCAVLKTSMSYLTMLTSFQ